MTLIYQLEYVGGPQDGVTSYSPRPYEALRDKSPPNHVYAADESGEAAVRWVDDHTRLITLVYRGCGEAGERYWRRRCQT